MYCGYWKKGARRRQARERERVEGKDMKGIHAKEEKRK